MINFHPFASSSRGNFYVVDDGQTKIMLDCGIPFKQIKEKLNFKTHEIEAVCLSHQHMDHSKAARDILKAGLDIYAKQETIDTLGLSGYRIHPIEANKQFNLGTWSILPFDLEHDCPNLGFLMMNRNKEKFLYVTDTYYCRYRFNDLSVIAIECNHSYDILAANVEAGTVPVEHKNRLIRSHFSLENVKEFLKANDLSMVREIYLIHLSSGNSDAERFKREIQELTGKMIFVAGK